MDQNGLRFGAFELKVSSYELRRAGLPVKLERIPMELLMLLVEKRGELVSREMIIQRLWGDNVFLETEHSINTAINKLRAVLQDHPKEPLFVQTVIGKGYRFIAQVNLSTPEPTTIAKAAAEETAPAAETVNSAGCTSLREPAILPSVAVMAPAAKPQVQGTPLLTVAADPLPLPAPASGPPQGARPLRVARPAIAPALILLLAATAGYFVRGWRDHRSKTLTR